MLVVVAVQDGLQRVLTEVTAAAVEQVIQAKLVLRVLLILVAVAVAPETARLYPLVQAAQVL